MKEGPPFLTIVMDEFRPRLAAACLGVRPAALDEVIVGAGIDAFLWLLDGGVIEIDGTSFRLEQYVETP